MVKNALDDLKEGGVTPSKGRSIVSKEVPFDENKQHRKPSDRAMNDTGEQNSNASSNTPPSSNLSFPTDIEHSYPGDLIDNSGPLESTGYRRLEFPNPGVCLAFYNKRIRNGEVKLHDWQIEQLEEFGNAKATSQHPYKCVLLTCNGSGKDAFIIASFVTWFALCKIKSRSIVTSSSGVQLTSQTEGYIRELCQSVNEYHGQEIFRIRQRFIRCMLSGSEIRLFATDEAGKAEGYHPMEPGSEMAIIPNEWKSIEEEITGALKRCTGYNYWIGVSTPGEPSGSLYYAFNNWPHTRKVTSYDCIGTPEYPHLSLEEIEEDKKELGEHSALFRSKHLALFTSLAGEVIIPVEVIDRLVANPPAVEYQSWPIRIGIDLAAGGDENCITLTRGNNVVKEIAFRESDTMVTADRINQILNDENIPKGHDFIFADDGGIGHGIINNLSRQGWNIKAIHNQWSAFSKKQFGNRGAENWYRIKRIFEEGLINISNLSTKTKEQLSSRKYKQMLVGARIYLESKKEAKAHGRPSPDRADALILSLTGLKLDDFLNDEKPAKSDTRTKERFNSMNAAYEHYENKVTFGKWNQEEGESKCRKVYNSLQVAMRK